MNNNLEKQIMKTTLSNNKSRVLSILVLCTFALTLSTNAGGSKTTITTFDAPGAGAGAGARASLKLDFSEYDRADPDELNRILWSALKPGQPMPAPVRSLRAR